MLLLKEHTQTLYKKKNARKKYVLEIKAKNYSCWHNISNVRV